MLSRSDTALALALFAARQVNAHAIVTSTQKILLPTARPANAYEVPANFPSVGFEHAYVPGFNDDFSNNMFDEIAARMDVKPIIRIGGTSGDIIKYNPDQKEPSVCITGKDMYNDCTHESSFILGPHYFDALTQYFQSARISLQAPLGPIHSDSPPNKTNVVSFIQQAYRSLGADRFEAIAIGNEPNFYERDGLAYVKDGLAAAKYMKENIKEIGSEDDGNPVWELLNTAWKSATDKAWNYNMSSIVNAWEKEDKRIKYVGEHYYQYDGKTLGVEDHLLNHTDLVESFGTLQNRIDWTRNVAKVPYILSEVGGPLTPEVEETGYFATSLWGANFLMYAMSHGVDRVSLVQRPGVWRALWTPFATKKTPGPRVQAQFYSMPFITDFLGKNVTEKRGVVNIDLKSEDFSAYAMFEGDALARIAVMNLRGFRGEGERKGVKVCLQGLSKDIKKATVGSLHADEGTAAGGWDVNKKNITWAGQQWSYTVNDGKVHGKIAQKELNVTYGTVDVVIPDSEAVIVYLR